MFLPFSGWLFNTETVVDLGKATSPPYDVISERDREDLLARSPYNIVRLLLPGRDPADYHHAAELLADWREHRVVIEDDDPRFYLYEIEYDDGNGGRRLAKGIIGALELVPFGSGVVPHEETMGKHRDDRMSLLEATQANLDPIIALSAAPELPSLVGHPAGTPRLAFEEQDGTLHRLYDVVDPEAVAAIESAVASHPVAIADGHHRYATARAHRERKAATAGSGPWDFIMAMVAPAEGSGLTIGPYHRLLPDLDFDRDAVLDAFEVSDQDPEPPRRAGHLVLVRNGIAVRLHPREEALSPLPPPWRQASTAVARELLYPRLGVDEEDARYMSDARDAVAAVASGSGTAVLVAPVPEHAVAEAGELGLRFPTKTTYFTPKPRAGLVVRSLRD